MKQIDKRDRYERIEINNNIEEIKEKEKEECMPKG